MISKLEPKFEMIDQREKENQLNSKRASLKRFIDVTDYFNLIYPN